LSTDTNTKITPTSIDASTHQHHPHRRVLCTLSTNTNSKITATSIDASTHQHHPHRRVLCTLFADTQLALWTFSQKQIHGKMRVAVRIS
jgi:hypothetical protein